MYDEFVKNADGIDTSKLAKKTDYGNAIMDIEGKIPSIPGHAAAATTTTTATATATTTAATALMIYI